MIIVIDNVSSHTKDGLQKIGVSDHLFWDADHKLFLFFGLPGVCTQFIRIFFFFTPYSQDSAIAVIVGTKTSTAACDNM
jgi:hypothetical protein